MQFHLRELRVNFYRITEFQDSQNSFLAYNGSLWMSLVSSWSTAGRVSVIID